MSGSGDSVGKSESTSRTTVVMFSKNRVLFFVGKTYIGRIDEMLKTKDSEMVHEHVTLMTSQSKSVVIQEIELKVT